MTDGVTPGLMWRVAVEDLTRIVDEPLAQMDEAVGPRASAVVAGGWIHNAMVAEAKRGQLGGYLVSELDEPGALGAAFLGGVAAGVLYGLDLRCGPIADMRGERRHVAVLNGGAAAADVSFEGCKGAARYAVARLEDDLRAFYVLDQRSGKLPVACVARGEPLLEIRRVDVRRPEPCRQERVVESAHPVWRFSEAGEEARKLFVLVDPALQAAAAGRTMHTAVHVGSRWPPPKQQYP